MRDRLRRLRVPDAFELLIAALCLGSGLTLSLGAPPPSSVQNILPGWLVTCWGATLFLGALLIVIGVLMRHRNVSTISRVLVGLRIERAGLVPLAAASAVFGLVIAVFGGWRGVLASGTYLAFAAACLFRNAEAADAERGLAKALSVRLPGPGKGGG